MNNRTLIKQTIQQKPAQVQNTFNQLMGRKLSDAIEAKRAEIGVNLIQRVNKDLE